MSAPVTLSVVSDAHLPLGVPSGAELIGKRALSALNWRVKRRRLHDGARGLAGLSAALGRPCDSMVMLGDMVNFGLAREFECGAETLRALGAGDHFVAIPGNHEALAPGWEAPLRRAWGGWLGGDDAAPTFPWLRRIGDVALIGVSSAVATPPFIAAGRVGPAQLARLDTLLRAAGRAGLARAVLIHHPPTDIAPARKSLRDAAALRAVLLDAGAELALHGHLHRFSLSSMGPPDRRIPVIGAPSLSLDPQDAGPHGDVGAGGWLSLRLERDARGWRVEVTRRAGADRAAAPLILQLPDGRPPS